MIHGMTTRPPAMADLLKDPYFRGMMRRAVQLPPNLTSPTLSPPWALWRLTTESKWQRGQFPTYADAYRSMRKQMEKEDTLDVCIVSKRKMWAPPIGFKWNVRQYTWCARCRRPSIFRTRYKHHALQVLTYDESQRCYFCGIRRVALPRHAPR
jgi:hypothetical protein